MPTLSRARSGRARHTKLLSWPTTPQATQKTPPTPAYPKQIDKPSVTKRPETRTGRLRAACMIRPESSESSEYEPDEAKERSSGCA